MFKNVCWTQRLFIMMISSLFIVSVSSMLSGCGNRGDLYLPDTGSKDDIKTKKVQQNPKKTNTTPVKKTS